MKNLERFIAAGCFVAALHAGDAWSLCNPSLVDLGNQTGQAGVGPYFDLDAAGGRDHVQWARRGGEGLLALERGGKGLIDNGSKLFGIGTPMLVAGRTPRDSPGFARYDSRQVGGNNDGVITAADAVWPQLRIWVDMDADGIPSDDEMRTLGSYGITALETVPKKRTYLDAAGNLIPYWAWATQRVKPGLGFAVEVYFLVLP